ncbi:MAG: hypothetical protein ACSHX3_06720 [Litorimonas sp.]
MRRTALILASTALILAPMSAAAKSRGFDTTISVPVQAPVKIEVVLSDDLAHRANNLPKKLSSRASPRSGNAGFAGDGLYGDRALNSLIEEVYEELNEDFARKGILVSDDADIVLRVTLEDVKNNRPTFEQLSRQTSLSFESFGTGGAEMSAELVDGSGNQLGTLSYRWFDSDLDRFDFQGASGVWSDARRAISRFSSKTAKTLSST